MTISPGSTANAADVLALVSAVETTSNPYSLVTVALERVIVFATGNILNGSGGGVSNTIALKYNAVTKASVVSMASSAGQVRDAFSLMYTEVPGAATQNITVDITGGGSLENLKIVVLRIKGA